jgi:hypothetical protein
MKALIGTTISLDKATLQHVQDSLAAIPNGARIALYTAINDTLKSERAELVRRMGAHINAKASDIRDEIKVHKTASAEDMSGELRISYKALPLGEFKGLRDTQRTSKRGVTVQPLKNQAAMQFKHAFTATVTAGKTGTHKGVFLREKLTSLKRMTPQALLDTGWFATISEARSALSGEGRRNAFLGVRQHRMRLRSWLARETVSGYASRLPIMELFGPSVVAAFEIDPEIQRITFEDTQEKLAERVRSKVDWLLDNPSVVKSRALRHI